MAPTAQAAPAAQTKFTLEDFAAVAETLPDHWLELIDGRIEIVPPPDKSHQKLINKFLRLLRRHNDQIEALGCDPNGSFCYFELPEGFNPQASLKGPNNVCPDASIPFADYWDSGRRPPALLVVEVLSFSNRENADRDLVTKTEIYAALEIPAYWILDRRDQSVWVHTQPCNGQYAKREQCLGETILAAPGLEFLQITPAQIFAE